MGEDCSCASQPVCCEIRNGPALEGDPSPRLRPPAKVHLVISSGAFVVATLGVECGRELVCHPGDSRVHGLVIAHHCPQDEESCVLVKAVVLAHDVLWIHEPLSVRLQQIYEPLVVISEKSCAQG